MNVSKLYIFLLAVVLVLQGCGQQSPKSHCDTLYLSIDEEASQTLPPGFVYLSDSIPDLIQEIRYYSSYNFVGKRIAGYEKPVAIVTVEAAKALKSIADSLRGKGYLLKVYDAYRPQQSVDHFLQWAEDNGDTLMRKYFYPRLTKSQIFNLGYIAQKSSHSRGSTLDLTLCDRGTGKEIDMGGSFDWFGSESAMDYPNLQPQQRQNRRILRDAMTQGGFVYLRGEWWHYTLKDEPYPDRYFDFPVR